MVNTHQVGFMNAQLLITVCSIGLRPPFDWLYIRPRNRPICLAAAKPKSFYTDLRVSLFEKVRENEP